MTAVGRMRPHTFCWKTKYDETPLKTRLGYSNNSSEMDLHRSAYIWNIESQWVCSFELADSSMLIFCGAFAPEMRGTSGKTAEHIVKALQSCHGPPAHLPFHLKVRIVDSDSAPSNHRAERILQERDARGWASVQTDCLCHKAHAAVSKTMELYKPVQTGIKNMALALSDKIHQMRHMVKDIVAEQLLILEGSPNLTEVAEQYRAEVVQLYTPAHSQARAVLILMSRRLLNGDWRGPLVHHCEPGCCNDKEETVTKIQYGLSALLSVTKPVVLTNNWAHWRRAFYFHGVFGRLHKLLYSIAAKLHLAAVEGSCSLSGKSPSLAKVWRIRASGPNVEKQGKKIAGEQHKRFLVKGSTNEAVCEILIAHRQSLRSLIACHVLPR